MTQHLLFVAKTRMQVIESKWSGRGDLNARPPAPKELAWLPIALSLITRFQCFQQVGEPAFRSKANPSSVNRSSFGTVLPQLRRCVANRERTRGSTPCITEHILRRTRPAIRAWSVQAICCVFSIRNWLCRSGNSARRTRYRWSGRSGRAKRRTLVSHRGRLYYVDSR